MRRGSAIPPPTAPTHRGVVVARPGRGKTGAHSNRVEDPPLIRTRPNFPCTYAIWYQVQARQVSHLRRHHLLRMRSTPLDRSFERAA